MNWKARGIAVLFEISKDSLRYVHGFCISVLKLKVTKKLRKQILRLNS